MEASNKSFISSTFWSERIGFSAGLATLDEMEKTKSWEKLNTLGEYFKKNLKKISVDNKIGLEITGLPALTSYYIPHKYSDIFQAFITQELLKYKYLGTQTFYMSTAHSKKKIDSYLDRLNDIFKIIKENFDNKNFIKKLKGPLPKKPFERMN
jgi:glutamate-1-semialdehyde aminotransferase